MIMEGDITAIGVSGRYWLGGDEQSAYDLLLESLLRAETSIRIVAYSLGCESPELENIFRIIKGKIHTGVEVQMIINRFWSAATYAQAKLRELEHPNFRLLDYDPENEHENLHAKIVIIDSKEILLGSANISKSGLFSNHEIMIRVDGGEFASRINSLIDVLASSIYVKRGSDD